MAVKTFTLIYNRAPAHSLAKETLDQTKAQAEALHRKGGKEAITFGAVVETANLLTVTAENAEAAVTAARLLLGISENQGEISIVESASVEKKSGR